MHIKYCPTQAAHVLMLQDLDGIILVVDPQKPEQEKELETLYMNFAQPHSLTIKQCLTLAVQVIKEGSQGLVTFNGTWRDAASFTNTCLQKSAHLLAMHMSSKAHGLQSYARQTANVRIRGPSYACAMRRVTRQAEQTK